MKPLTSVVINARRTEGDGGLAYVIATASWVSSGATTTTNVRAVMIWRRDADGKWRIAYEGLTPEAPPQ
jgi:ketosteroid isomerase-like protein